MSHASQSRTERKEIADGPASALVEHRLREESVENAWRRDAVSRLLGVFYVLNGDVLAFVLIAWLGEWLSDRAPKMLSERTLLALIAGSTTQLGALALFVGRSLAPVTRQPSESGEAGKT